MFHFVIKGTGFSSKNLQEIRVYEETLFCIGEVGVIQEIIEPDAEAYETVLAERKEAQRFQGLPQDFYLLPGFTDLHIHAPQWAQSGTALDIPLCEWLNTYTFPLESKFADLTSAQQVYDELATQLLANGTTTALYSATIYYEANRRLAETCAEKGQRGLIGKVVMDDLNESPEYYRDQTTRQALEEAERFIRETQTLAQQTKQGVYPVVTPRFIPSCTEEILKGLGELAAKYQVRVQSRCSEGDWEHQFVQERFGKSDAQALNDFGLLTEKAVMAHAGFLEEANMSLFHETGTAVAHRPISNACFGNAVTPIAKLVHQHQVEVGLGGNLSGGFSPSPFGNLKQAAISSRILGDGVDATKKPEIRGVKTAQVTVNGAFYLATVGGGQALGLPTGKLEKGYTWDVQTINTSLSQARIPKNPGESLLDVFQKILYLARPENI